MALMKQKGDKYKYNFAKESCLGCACFQAGLYQVRGATGSGGSRNTGNVSPQCMWRAYRGCPDENTQNYSIEREKERIKQGWKYIGTY